MRTSKSRLIPLLLMLALVLVGVAAADTYVYTDSVPLQSTNWSTTMTVPQFNPADYPACSTLTSVTVELEGNVEGSAGYENQDPVPADITLNLRADITLERPDTTPLVLIQPLVTVNEMAAAYDGVPDFDGPSGSTFPGLAGVISDTVTLTSPDDLAIFIGNGNVVFPATATGSSTGSGAGNLLLQFITQASANVQVTYNCEAADWGDAPDSYNTQLASDGPRHVITPGLQLGACVDAESDGQQSAAADGDDGNVGTATQGTCAVAGDDEDGVAPTPGFKWTIGFGGTGKVDATVTGDGCLSGWIDWNNDGDFAGGFDQIINNVAVSTGTTTFDTFFVPVDPSNQSFYARFRLGPRDGSDTCTTPLPSTGLSLGGEVEDHVWSFGPLAVGLQSAGASPQSHAPLPLAAAGMLLLTIGSVIAIRRRPSRS